MIRDGVVGSLPLLILIDSIVSVVRCGTSVIVPNDAKTSYTRYPGGVSHIIGNLQLGLQSLRCWTAYWLMNLSRF